MIVKNEAPVIERCLASVLPYICSWVVVDTGSSDETCAIVRDFFARAEVPGELIERPWRDFAINRTEGLRAAQGRADYTLIIDADDTLEVREPANLRDLSEDAYAATIVDGTALYSRPQLIRSVLDWSYRGVLHEFLVCPEAKAAQVLPGFIIHRNHDGARRRDPQTYARDAALLEAAIDVETDEMLLRRYTYYLGQSYRDAREPQKSANAYARRAEMGGWEEERWHARLQCARSLLEAEDESSFLKTVAQAYTERPQRAEPLLDLARYFRDRGRHEEAMQAAKLAAKIPYPTDDRLFVEDFAYRFGIPQELSINGYYCQSPEDRELGKKSTQELAIGRDVPPDMRWLARNHLIYYAGEIGALCRSWTATRLRFSPPPGYVAMNPSICREDDGFSCIVRTVNFDVSDGLHYVVPDSGPINTRNFLVRLSNKLEIETVAEVQLPSEFGSPKYPRVLGLEDVRLFPWKGQLWCLGCTRQLNGAGLYEVVMAEIEQDSDQACIGDWHIISDRQTGRHEKNWTPVCDADELRLLYAFDPTTTLLQDGSGKHSSIPALALDHLRGGTPLIPFDTGWLCITHEVQLVGDRRVYLHRFTWLDSGLQVRAVSEPYCFRAKGLEFAAGLCWAEDGRTLAVSYGVNDAEAWVGILEARDIREILLWR